MHNFGTPCATYAMEMAWPFGSLLCKVQRYITRINQTSTILFLMCTALQRYSKVTKLKNGTEIDALHRTKLFCRLVWNFAIIISLPDLIFANVDSIGHKKICNIRFYPPDPENGFEKSHFFNGLLQIMHLLVQFLVPSIDFGHSITNIINFFVYLSLPNSMYNYIRVLC